MGERRWIRGGWTHDGQDGIHTVRFIEDQQQMKILTITMAMLLAAIIAFMLFVGTLSTGPNCPGMDPQWLGWCE